MFKIAIVEDNQTAMAKLQGYLERYAQENNENFDIAAFGDALAFLDSYRRIYDMVFMDIELPFINGMEAAQRLREIDQQVVLIFVTNMAQFAVKGYEVDALDYLVKPVHYGDFELKLRRAVSRLKEAQEAILVQRQSGMVRLRIQEISYIEVRGHTLIFHTETGEIKGSGTLHDLENKLKNKGFLRCNKCYLVNQRHIAAVQGYTLVMTQGEELQISRPRKKTFMSELAETMGNENVL